jgi:hypothetical protein
VANILSLFREIPLRRMLGAIGSRCIACTMGIYFSCAPGARICKRISKTTWRVSSTRRWWTETPLRLYVALHCQLSNEKDPLTAMGALGTSRTCMHGSSMLPQVERSMQKQVRYTHCVLFLVFLRFYVGVYGENIAHMLKSRILLRVCCRILVRVRSGLLNHTLKLLSKTWEPLG